MKRIYIVLTLACAVSASLLSSCSREEILDPESVIVADSKEQNDFDKWLEANYVDPYNIRVKYRYEMNESDYNYYTIPPSLEYSIMMAHLVKYMCIDTYDEVAGVAFTRQYFPKMFFYTGEWEYKNNGTFILGTAEGGRKIFLAGLNYLPRYINSASSLNHYYLKTIHHEFTHILNQTKPFTNEYRQITPTSYVAGDWSTTEYSSGYLGRGFISAYSQDSDREDFAEMLSLYVTNSEETWAEWMATAKSEGGGDALIDAKLDIVRSYMQNNFDIDIDQLRDVVLRRQDEVVAGRVDLTSLDIK